MQLLFSILFVISRLAFLNPGNVFFDSKEYLTRLASGSLVTALTSGHPPLHSGFVLTFWPFYQFLSLIGINPVLPILLCQVLLSLLIVWLFYRTVSLLLNKEIAWRSMVVFTLIPIFWIVNEAVMMETTYLFYWILSLYFLTRYLVEKKQKTLYLIISSLSWVMAFLTHTVVIMWIPLFILLAFTINKKRSVSVLSWGLLALVTSSLVNAYLLSRTYSTDLYGGLYWLYSAKFGEHAWFQFTIETVFRYLRNWILPLGYNNSWILLLISIVGLFGWLLKDKKIFWIGVLWIVPSFVTNQWWDSLLYGRHSLIVSFALAIFAGGVLNKKSYRLFTGVLFVISLSALYLLLKPIPYIETAKVANTLPPGGLLIDSHFARPQTDGEYFGEIIFVDEPGWPAKNLSDRINSYLTSKKPVFITGQALSEPYGLFSGPYVHPLSISYKYGYILSYLSQKYYFEKYIDIDSDYNLCVYEIKEGSVNYPDIIRLDKSRKRIDWLDPLRILSSGIL